MHAFGQVMYAALKVVAKHIFQIIYSSVPQVDAVAEGVTKHTGDVSVPQVGYKTHIFQTTYPIDAVAGSITKLLPVIAQVHNFFPFRKQRLPPKWLQNTYSR